MMSYDLLCEIGAYDLFEEDRPMSVDGEDEDLLGDSQNLSIAALLGPVCRYGEALGLFLAGRRCVAQTGSSRPLSGLGKGARGSRGLTRWAPAVCLGNSGQQTWSCCGRRQ